MRSDSAQLVPRDAGSLVLDIHRALDVPQPEVELYVAALRGGGWEPKDPEARALAETLVSRGLLVRAARGNSYLAVHPRMALSNLFRAYEERAAMQRKQKRLLVDKLTLELIPLLPEESKGTNPGSARGGRKARG